MCAPDQDCPCKQQKRAMAEYHDTLRASYEHLQEWYKDMSSWYDGVLPKVKAIAEEPSSE